MTTSKQAGMDAALTGKLESLQRLLEMESQSNLLAGLLTEAALINDSSRLTSLRDLIKAAKEKIEGNLNIISDPAQQKKLAALYNDLGTIETSDGIIATRTYELNRLHDADVAFENAQAETAKLKKAVDDIVELLCREGGGAGALVGRRVGGGGHEQEIGDGHEAEHQDQDGAQRFDEGEAGFPTGALRSLGASVFVH
jgi:hypothetical protein